MTAQLFDATRRGFLTMVSALGATWGAGMAVAPSVGQAKDGRGQRLWYKQPAATWNEALPLGNGRLGAMVFGRVGQERLQLNEDTLWAGGPYRADNPEALAALPEVRRLLAAGDYKAASELAQSKMMGRPLSQMPYGTLGDVLVDFGATEAPRAYERVLDLETAITTTRYTTAAGRFVHEAFVSAPDQVIVFHVTGPRGRLGFEIAHSGPGKAKYTMPNYVGNATEYVAERAVNWLLREEAGALPDGMTMTSDGDGAVLITGRNIASDGIAGALTYALRIKLVTDGVKHQNDGRLGVGGATQATVVMAAATSFVKYDDVSGDPVAIVRRQSDTAAAKAFDRLKADHIADYRALYGTVSLDLGTTEAAKLPTDARIAFAEAGQDPALSALYFQFGRYLMISSSRPGTQPANLQGVWNEGTNPPWGSKYTININTEMNYWPADPAGLSACVEPLLRMTEDLAVTGAKTAHDMYGARGWVTHHNTDLWRATAPIDGVNWGLWPCGGAWLCTTLWDHYDYTRDEAVLKRLYPLMKGASLFFLDTLVEDPGGRGLITSPSLSPENQHPFGTSLCAGPAMDRQIVRDLFDRTERAGRLLEVDSGLMGQIASARARIAPDVIGAGGQFQEWLEDWDAQAPEQAHRHVSHLYAVYPSEQVNVRDTPALIEAAKVSLRTRGDLATGWGTAWRLCLWARMGEGDHAHEVLKGLTGAQRTYPNMFDAHPPFQIDGNFGGAAGIMEMLVQSWGGEVHILPALPRAWPSGEIKGVRARGGLAVDVAWKAGAVDRVKLVGPAGTEVRLRHRGRVSTVRLDDNGVGVVKRL